MQLKGALWQKEKIKLELRDEVGVVYGNEEGFLHWRIMYKQRYGEQ
jgi:hypothetical protein